MNIKQGEEIKDRDDLQNLITGVILHQKKSFTFQKLLKVLQKKIVGSKYENNLKLVKTMLDETMKAFDKAGWIIVNRKTLEYENNCLFLEVS